MLQDIETSFRNLLNNMLEGVALHEVIYNGKGKAINYRILSVNPAFQTHTGLNSEIIRGKLATEAFNTESPPYLDIYVQTAESGQPTSFETYFQPLEKHVKISVSSPKKTHSS